MRIFGINPVLARLEAAPRSVRKVFLQRQQSDSKIYNLCREAGIPIEALPENQFRRLTAGIHSQGVIAETDGFAYVPLEELFSAETALRPTLIVLDGINDPQNLGSMLRTLACLGGFAVIIPRHESVDVTEAALRVACGGENYVPVAKVANVSQTLLAAKREGYWAAATVVSGGKSLFKQTLPQPLAVVFGSEGAGVRPGVLKNIDLMLTLPMSGAELSFNVAVACALVSYEVARQRTAHPAKKED